MPPAACRALHRRLLMRGHDAALTDAADLRKALLEQLQRIPAGRLQTQLCRAVASLVLDRWMRPLLSREPARVDQGVARWRGRMCGCWQRLTFYLRMEKSTASSQSHRDHVHHLPQSARRRSLMPDNRPEHRGHQRGQARGRRPASAPEQREYCAASQQCRNVDGTRCAPRQGC